MSKLYDEMSSFMTDERERLGREMTNRLISKLQAQQKEQGFFFKSLTASILKLIFWYKNRRKMKFVADTKFMYSRATYFILILKNPILKKIGKIF